VLPTDITKPRMNTPSAVKKRDKCFTDDDINHYYSVNNEFIIIVDINIENQFTVKRKIL
jgi:hypothetical protein